MSWAKEGSRENRGRLHELNELLELLEATDGIRTHDLVLTKDALYQLSYSSRNTDEAGHRHIGELSVIG